MVSTDWHSELKTALDTLAHAVVRDAWVNEMALYGPDDAGHFTDPILNFVQANVLELRVQDGQTVHISCVQTDDGWALWPHLVSSDKRLSADAGEGTFRTRHMPEFPCGAVATLELTDDISDLQTLRMTVDEQDIILCAGEVYENPDGTLSVVDHDESVLVFFDAGIYRSLTFNEPAYRPSRRAI